MKKEILGLLKLWKELGKEKKKNGSCLLGRLMFWEMKNLQIKFNFPFLIMVINNQNLMIRIRA